MKVCESVLKGHPDKVADQIGDALMQAIVGSQPEANRSAIEVLLTGNTVVLAGEMRTNTFTPSMFEFGRESVNHLIRKTIMYAGYPNGFDNTAPQLMWYVRPQSHNINESTQGIRSGDQGITYGHAAGNSETNFLPVAQWVTLRVTEILERLCDRSTGTYGPDGKCQVTFDNGTIKSVTASVRCNQGLEENLQIAIRDALQGDFLLAGYGIQNAKLTVNPPNGKFYIGGPVADCGLTGRKLAVDSYCGLAPHGGGAFSGKDLSKVDRTGAYMARMAAKQLVKSGVCSSATVGLSWRMGTTCPDDITVEHQGGDDLIVHAMAWDLVMGRTLNEWVHYFYNNMPMEWSELAQGCHFRDNRLPWETV